MLYAVCGMLYAVYCQARGGSYLTWDAQRARFWDSAVAGSSALRAAILRRFNEELSHLNGDIVATVFFDLTKFFDHIDPVVVMRECMLHGAPALVLALSMQLHLAVRIIMSNGCTADPICISRSILQGCRFSCSFARDAMYFLLDQLHALHPSKWVNLHTYFENHTLVD